MAETIADKIAVRRARVAELERELIAVQAELRAYEDAASMFADASPPETVAPLPSVARVARSVILGGARRVRKSTATWEAIVAECGANGRIFGINDVLAAAMRRNFAPTRGNVRSQLAAYANRHLLERVSAGSFRFTDTGQALFRATEMEAAASETEAAA